MPGVPVYSLLLVCILPIKVHTRPRVQRAPGIPHALNGGRKVHANLGRFVPRDREVAFVVGTVIASAAKQSILSSRRGGLLRCARNDESTIKTPYTRRRSQSNRRYDTTTPCSSDKPRCRRNRWAR